MNYFAPVFLTTFFFVSGYLFKENMPFTKVFEQRTRTLFIPQLVFGILLAILTHVLTFKSHQPPLSDQLLGVLFHHNGRNNGLWFVAALWSYSIVFYWVLRCCKTTTALLITAICFFVGNWVYSFLIRGPYIPFYLNHFGHACFYMSLGVIYKRHEGEINSVIRSWWKWAALVLYIVIIFLVGQYYSIFGSKYLVDSILITSLGLFVIISYSKRKFICNKAVLFVGSNSLLYFALHGKPLSALETLTRKYLFESGIVDHTVIIDETLRFSLTVIDALIVAVFVLIINRWMPWLTGKGFKLWKT